MAQRVEIQLVDDVDGSPASETIRFGLDGTSYEIDLNTENARRFRDALAGYISSARRATSATTRAGRDGSSARRGSRSDLDQVRAWARDNGHKVSDRGRVPLQVLEAYDSAH